MVPDDPSVVSKPHENYEEITTIRTGQTARFLNFLFDGISSGYVEFGYLKPGFGLNRSGKPGFYTLSSNWLSVAQEVLTHYEDRTIIMGPAPRSRNKQNIKRDSDVVLLNCVWANLDYQSADLDPISIIRLTRALLPRPSLVVDSLYGRQLYYVFKSPLYGGGLLEWELMMKDLQGVFSTKAEVRPTQMMPVPGSRIFIHKTAPSECRLDEEESSWTRYTTEEIKSMLNSFLQNEQHHSSTISVPIVLSGSDIYHDPVKDDSKQVRLEYNLPPNYELDSEGCLWFNPPSEASTKRSTNRQKVSNSYLRIAQIQEDVNTGQVAFVIEFTYLQHTKRVSILRSQMADARQLVAALAGDGAPVTTNNARCVLSYLSDYEHAFGMGIPRKQVTYLLGRDRKGVRFFFPGVSSTIEFSTSAAGDLSLHRAFSSRNGSLNVWLRIMEALKHESMLIPQTAVLASLVPPLQSNLRIPNFILDIYGNSSTGKSTSLKLAASVYGRPDDPDSLVLQWMSTATAVENIARLCNELPIFLDDAQHCPGEIKNSIVYLIANGKGKGRAKKGGHLDELPSWSTVALSTSEEPLRNSSPYEGLRGRILSIGGPVPPFPAGMGSFVKSLEDGIINNHGHAGEVYIRHLVGWSDLDWHKWRLRYADIRNDFLKASSSNLTGRISGYVAAIQLAAEIACPLLRLPFIPEQVGSFLMGHVLEEEVDRENLSTVLAILADFYVRNINKFAGDERFVLEKGASIFGSSRRHEYVGFLSTTIDSVCKAHKWNRNAILKRLTDAGFLYAAEDDRYTKKVGVAGLKLRMVCLKWSALLPDDNKPVSN